MQEGEGLLADFKNLSLDYLLTNAVTNYFRWLRWRQKLVAIYR
jgi:hypothetical protein